MKDSRNTRSIDTHSLCAGIELSEGVSRSELNRNVQGTHAASVSSALDTHVGEAYQKLNEASRTLYPRTVCSEEIHTSLFSSLFAAYDSLADLALQESQGTILVDKNYNSLSGIPRATRLARQFEKASEYLDTFASGFAEIDERLFKPLDAYLNALTTGIEQVYDAPLPHQPSSFPSVDSYRDAKHQHKAMDGAVAAYDTFHTKLTALSKELRQKIANVDSEEIGTSSKRGASASRKRTYSSAALVSMGAFCGTLGFLAGTLYNDDSSSSQIDASDTDAIPVIETFIETLPPGNFVELPFSSPYDHLTIEFKPNFDDNILHIEFVDPMTPQRDTAYRGELYIPKIETP